MPHHLHITDGDSVAGTLRESAIPGDVSTYGDLMYEGSAPSGLDPEAWCDTRARFMTEAGYATPGEARQYLKACDDTLAAWFPSVESGLSRTEHQALSVLHEHGSLSGRRLFAAVQRLEEQVFMGDLSFYRLLIGLSSARHPLIQLSDRNQRSLGEVTITEAGRDVMEGRADHIELNGIDRWLGGAHLKGDKAAWRWD